jgi:wobble nucleotide-excising tRNase
MTRYSLDKENAKHIEILNREMGETRDQVTSLNNKVSKVENDICWIKTSVEKIEKNTEKADSRTWYIVTGIIISIALTVMFRVFM